MWNGRKVVGLNERLRFLKYHVGDYFRAHEDGTYFREEPGDRYVQWMPQKLGIE